PGSSTLSELMSMTNGTGAVPLDSMETCMLADDDVCKTSMIFISQIPRELRRGNKAFVGLRAVAKAGGGSDRSGIYWGNGRNHRRVRTVLRSTSKGDRSRSPWARRGRATARRTARGMGCGDGGRSKLCQPLS